MKIPVEKKLLEDLLWRATWIVAQGYPINPGDGSDACKIKSELQDILKASEPQPITYESWVEAYFAINKASEGRDIQKTIEIAQIKQTIIDMLHMLCRFVTCNASVKEETGKLKDTARELIARMEGEDEWKDVQKNIS